MSKFHRLAYVILSPMYMQQGEEEEEEEEVMMP